VPDVKTRNRRQVVVHLAEIHRSFSLSSTIVVFSFVFLFSFRPSSQFNDFVFFLVSMQMTCIFRSTISIMYIFYFKSQSHLEKKEKKQQQQQQLVQTFNAHSFGSLSFLCLFFYLYSFIFFCSQLVSTEYDVTVRLSFYLFFLKRDD